MRVLKPCAIAVVIRQHDSARVNPSKIEVALMDAEHAKTLKAVAEYLDDYCSEETHAACKDRLLRRQCLICLMGITRCLSKGKMPGEE